MAEIVGAVAKANLRASGRIVPAELATWLQAITFDDEGWGVWHDDFWGFSLSEVQRYVAPNAQMHFFSRVPVLLSEPSRLSQHRLGEEAGSPEGMCSLEITAPGRLQAVIGYFSATLAPGCSLSNFPSYPGSNWAVWVWPLRHTDVATGDMIQVEVQRPSQARDIMEWKLDCRMVRGRCARNRRAS